MLYGKGLVGHATLACAVNAGEVKLVLILSRLMNIVRTTTLYSRVPARDFERALPLSTSLKANVGLLLNFELGPKEHHDGEDHLVYVLPALTSKFLLSVPVRDHATLEVNEALP